MFTVYMTASDLEKSFNFFKTVEARAISDSCKHSIVTTCYIPEYGT